MHYRLFFKAVKLFFIFFLSYIIFIVSSIRKWRKYHYFTSVFKIKTIEPVHDIFFTGCMKNKRCTTLQEKFLSLYKDSEKKFFYHLSKDMIKILFENLIFHGDVLKQNVSR